MGAYISCLWTQVEEALGHEYLATLHDISDEPVCADPFNFDLESDDLTPDVVSLYSQKGALSTLKVLECFKM
jgi:hypothetical protein